MNAFPSKLRTYEAFDNMKQKLASFKKVNMTIFELKSEAMKDRLLHFHIDFYFYIFKTKINLEIF